MIVISGNEREDKPPCLPIPRGAALASAIQQMNSHLDRRRPVQKKHAFYMLPDTPMRSVKYLKNIIKGAPQSGPIKINKPATASKKILISLSSLTAASRRITSWNMLILFPIKIREKLVKKRKSESAKADPKDCENYYGIDHLKIGEDTHDLDYSK